MITFSNVDGFLVELGQEPVDVVRIDQRRTQVNDGTTAIGLVASFIGDDGDVRKVGVPCGNDYHNGTCDGSRQYAKAKEELNEAIRKINQSAVEKIEVRPGEFE